MWGGGEIAANPWIFRAGRPIQRVYFSESYGLNGTAPALCDKEELVCENRCAEPWEAMDDFTPSAAPPSARSGQRGPPTLLKGSSKPLPPATAEVGSDLATGRAARRLIAPSLLSWGLGRTRFRRARGGGRRSGTLSAPTASGSDGSRGSRRTPAHRAGRGASRGTARPGRPATRHRPRW